MSRYPVLSDFSRAFAAAYRGFMAEHRVSGRQIADKLDRNIGYVSERVNAKRPLDTEDVDALAMLVGEAWSGRTLMIELARRAKETLEVEYSNVTSMDDHRLASLDDEKAAASALSEDRGEDDGYDA